ncbi:MAG: hypothetical protein ACE5E1_07150, partial [Phycisphaerae bacterium]
VWSFFGGAACRAAALDAAREEKISLREAFKYARSHFTSFAVAPLIPVIFVLVGGLFLWIGGLIGAIPAAGEVLVGILFFLSLLAGFFVAVVLILGVAGFPLMTPAIAADNLDALDAISMTYNYIAAKPWRMGFYALLATCYGAICIFFVKLFVMVMLWAVGLFMGASMNWGSAYAVDADGKAVKVESKLDAMWQPPDFTATRPFIGTFSNAQLRHVSAFGRFCLKAWIYTLWGMVAAVVVSFFYTASTVIYFLLRREADLTDWEEVYLETAGGEAAAPTPESPDAAPATDAT